MAPSPQAYYSSSMRAAVLDEPGSPLTLVELPDPRPDRGQLLVRVEACGACHSDIHLADGEWRDTLSRRVRPTILGHEIVGTIEERGAGVAGLNVGERVGVGWVGWSCGECEFCLEGDDNLCLKRRVTGIDMPGGYATHAILHASQAIRIPATLRPTEAAPLLCAGVTVYRGMRKAAITPGQRVAVFGVGGLGHIAVQLAKLAGATTVAVDLDEEKLALARTLGCDLALAADRATTSILALGGAHVAVVTAASAAAYDAALHSMRKGGTIVVVGLPSEPLGWLADDLATSEVRIVGSAVGSRADLSAILELAASGRVRCVVETVALEEINEAFDRFRRGRVTGRIVVVPK